jgi:hypothetical protein
VFAVSHPIEVCPCKHAFLAVTRTPTSFRFLFLTIHCWITTAIASNADITGRTKVDVVVKTKIANAAAIIGRTRAINDFARKQELYTLPPPLSSVRSRRKIILNNNIPCNLITEMCVLAFSSPDLTNGALNFTSTLQATTRRAAVDLNPRIQTHATLGGRAGGGDQHPGRAWENGTSNLSVSWGSDIAEVRKDTTLVFLAQLCSNICVSQLAKCRTQHREAE